MIRILRRLALSAGAICVLLGPGRADTVINWCLMSNGAVVTHGIVVVPKGGDAGGEVKKIADKYAGQGQLRFIID